MGGEYPSMRSQFFWWANVCGPQNPPTDKWIIFLVLLLINHLEAACRSDGLGLRLITAGLKFVSHRWQGECAVLVVPNSSDQFQLLLLWISYHLSPSSTKWEWKIREWQRIKNYKEVETFCTQECHWSWQWAISHSVSSLGFGEGELVDPNSENLTDILVTLQRWRTGHFASVLNHYLSRRTV